MKLWNRIRWKMAGLWADESGMGVVEVILIIVVLIGLVIIFKTRITGVVNDIFWKKIVFAEQQCLRGAAGR